MFELAKFVGIVGDVKAMVIIALIISLLLIVNKKQKEAILIISSFSIAVSASYVLKHLFKIPRPEHMLIAETGYRFPSGHATAAGVVFVLLIFFAQKYLNKSSQILTKYMVYAIATLWLSISMYARLYLQVHYVIDVLAGATLGIVSALFVVHLITKHLSYRRGKDFI